MKNEENNHFAVIYNDPLILSGIIAKRDKWNHYMYNNIPVPRVSEILSATIGKDYLKKWAAKLGDNYENESLRILDTGTLAHYLIEDFLTYGHIKDNYDSTTIKYADRDQSYNCFNNFISWWNYMIDTGYKIDVLELEHTVTCPYYGGTIDCIANITDPDGYSANYILDFKSSKSISQDYFLQTMMYLKAYEYHDAFINLPTINGIGVIRVDKEKSKYEYMIARKDIDYNFLYSLNEAVNAMVYWFYNQINISYEYKQFRNYYNNE